MKYDKYCTFCDEYFLGDSMRAMLHTGHVDAVISVDVEIPETPPPLGVNVQEKIDTTDKMGG